MTFGSLFAGIGGMDLGLERAGMECRWQVEIDPFARKVLEKHWPNVKRYEDIRTVNWGEVERVDLIAGGFPCQDISNAGKRAGIEGARSGLWSEYARAIRTLQPRVVYVENVAALLGRGLGRVLGDLAESGYDAQWDCIPASAFGAPHQRDRVWIVADARGEQRRRRRTEANLFSVQWETERALQFGHRRQRGARPDGAPVPDSARDGRISRRASDATEISGGREPDRGGIGADVSDADGWGFEVRAELDGAAERAAANWGSRWRHPDGCGCSTEWCAEPELGRVVDGLPNRVDRIRCLGNAVVPQVAEWLGRRILAAAR